MFLFRILVLIIGFLLMLIMIFIFNDFLDCLVDGVSDNEGWVEVFYVC